MVSDWRRTSRIFEVGLKDGRTDGQTLLKRCEDASKKENDEVAGDKFETPSEVRAVKQKDGSMTSFNTRNDKMVEKERRKY